MYQVLHPFAIYFTILANFQTMTFLSKKNKKRTNKMKKKQTKKQIVIERQILKTCKVGYPYDVVMVLAYLSFASSEILLRRGN